ncbi:MAG: tail fiber domain-containing protein, partial [Saprospiraceae bacterium]
FPSDARFKYNISDAHIPGLSFITKLHPVRYQFDTRKFDFHIMQNMPDSTRQKRMQELDQYRGVEKEQTGFLAQEVEEACHQINYTFSGLHVPENETDNYSIAYGSFVPLLVKAVQEQQAEIENLKQTIEALKSENYNAQSSAQEIQSIRVEIEAIKRLLANYENN